MGSLKVKKEEESRNVSKAERGVLTNLLNELLVASYWLQVTEGCNSLFF